MSHIGLKKMSVDAHACASSGPARGSRASARRARFFGDFLADLGRRRGHDVQVSRVRRQVVARAFHFDERRHQRLAAGVHRRVVELRLVEQPVAGHVGRHLGDDVADRLRDRVAVGVLGDGAEDGVAHDHWRIGGVQDDDRLAALGTADGLDALAGGLGELVDVGPGARPRRDGCDRRDDLRVGHVDDARHRVDDRDGGLPAAGDHVDVRRIEVLAQVGRRDHGRADRRRRQVDGADAGLGISRRGVAVHVGAGGLEQQIRLLVQTQQPVRRPRGWSPDRACGRAPGPRTPGSMPTIQRGSSHSERSSLYSRSVLMLPDPTMATEAF